MKRRKIQSSLLNFTVPQAQLDAKLIADTMVRIGIKYASAQDYVDVGFALLRQKRFVEAKEIFEQGVEHVKVKDPLRMRILQGLREAVESQSGANETQIATPPSDDSALDGGDDPIDIEATAVHMSHIEPPTIVEDTSLDLNQALPKNAWAHLSAEMVVHIFQYLNLHGIVCASGTCKRWYRAAQDPSLYRQIDLTAWAPKVNNRAADTLARRGAWNLRKLVLANCSRLNEFCLMPIREKICLNVTELNLSGCHRIDTQTMLEVFAAIGPKLERVSLNGCHRLLNSAISLLLRRAERLVYLDLTGLIEISDQVFQGNKLVCRNTIKWLTLDGCSRLTDDSFAALFTSFLPQLRVLSCRNCSGLGRRAFSILSGDEAVGQRSSLTPQLRTLDLTGCCQNQLNLLRSAQIPRSHDSMLLFASGSEHLVRVCLPRFQLTDQAIEYLTSFCNKLQLLDLDENSQLTDNALLCIVQNCPMISGLSMNHCCNITDVGIFNLTSCKHLCTLAFSHASRISDRSLVSMQSLSLKALSLRNCTSLTATGLQQFLKKVKSIQKLDISFCDQIALPHIHALRCTRSDVVVVANMDYNT